MTNGRSHARKDRATVRVYRLGEEPQDDLAACTTAAERISLLRELTERAWSLSGRPLPDYDRSAIPIRVIRGS
jgi:hypothetical protein